MNLTDYVKEVSRQDFGIEFQHTASWNSRLQTTGGRFFPEDGQDLFVARTHAVQESDALGTRAVGLGHTAFVEHPLDVHRRKDVVVDAVAGFLFFLPVSRASFSSP